MSKTQCGNTGIKDNTALHIAGRPVMANHGDYNLVGQFLFKVGHSTKSIDIWSSAQCASGFPTYI